VIIKHSKSVSPSRNGATDATFIS